MDLRRKQITRVRKPLKVIQVGKYKAVVLNVVPTMPKKMRCSMTVRLGKSMLC